MLKKYKECQSGDYFKLAIFIGVKVENSIYVAGAMKHDVQYFYPCLKVFLEA